MENNLDNLDNYIAGFDEESDFDRDYSEETKEDDDIVDLGEDDEQEETPEETEENINLADLLYEEFEWEGIPKDIDPISAIKMIKEGYENIINDLQNKTPEEVPQDYFIQEKQEMQSAYKEWLSLSPKEALIEELINEEGYDEEDAIAEADDLENEGKLERKYRALKTSIKKEYEESLTEIEEQAKGYAQKQANDRAMMEQQQLLMIDNSISNLESPLFEVTKKDKEFVRNLYKSGKIKEITNNPATIAEMVLAYVKVQEIKNGQVNMKKQVAKEIINNMSKEPLVNGKIGREKTTNIFQRK